MHKPRKIASAKVRKLPQQHSRHTHTCNTSPSFVDKRITTRRRARATDGSECNISPQIHSRIDYCMQARRIDEIYQTRIKTHKAEIRQTHTKAEQILKDRTASALRHLGFTKLRFAFLRGMKTRRGEPTTRAISVMTHSGLRFPIDAQNGHDVELRKLCKTFNGELDCPNFQSNLVMPLKRILDEERRVVEAHTKAEQERQQLHLKLTQVRSTTIFRAGCHSKLGPSLCERLRRERVTKKVRGSVNQRVSSRGNATKSTVKARRFQTNIVDGCFAPKGGQSYVTNSRRVVMSSRCCR